MLAVAGIAACGGGENTAGTRPDPFAAHVDAGCTSGILSDSNESESPRMQPGRACNACHGDFNAAMGESAPIFTFAGTVYATAHEPDLCHGGGGPTDLKPTDGGRPPLEPPRDPTAARVEVLDATGRLFGAQVNTAGNFMAEGRYPMFVPPYTAKVTYQGRERAMLVPQTNGDCNACHTETGDMAAPGRIVLP
ncbi:MAG TPA: hypothetical protein VHJ20_21770 [Polyangia bacterium]|nr:hypothetical protein [Polyangia bacterium]